MLEIYKNFHAKWLLGCEMLQSIFLVAKETIVWLMGNVRTMWRECHHSEIGSSDSILGFLKYSIF